MTSTNPFNPSFENHPSNNFHTQYQFKLKIMRSHNAFISFKIYSPLNHRLLKVDWFVVGSQTSFLERFTQSLFIRTFCLSYRMSMTSSSNIFRRSTILNSNNSLCNHFTSPCSNNVSSKDTVGLSFCNNLDKSVSVLDSLG